MSVKNHFSNSLTVGKKISLSLSCSLALISVSLADEPYVLEPSNITAILVSSKLDELNRNIYQRNY